MRASMVIAAQLFAPCCSMWRAQASPLGAVAGPPQSTRLFTRSGRRTARRMESGVAILQPMTWVPPAAWASMKETVSSTMRSSDQAKSSGIGSDLPNPRRSMRSTR